MSQESLSTNRLSSTITIGGDLTVNRIGYGAMQLTGPNVWGEYPDRTGGLAFLKEVVAAGVNFIDTADTYGPFTNEQLIHDALYPYPQGFVVATKGGFVRGGPRYEDLDAVGNRMYLRQAAFTSARRLGIKQIDLYYLHTPQAKDVPFEDQIRTLKELQDEGVIKHIGLSNITAEQLHVAQTIVDVVAVTAHYNIGVRVSAPLLKAAKESGIVFSPWHPAALPKGDSAPCFHAVLDPIAEKHGVSLPQLALAWQLHRYENMLPIPGTTSLDHLKENLAAAAISLTQDEVDTITHVVPEE
ncbi:oxidoreductase [Reticulibacter mediterranei]|uniref:Oxidoreductase n=1 Tax=Reticulibacter mediterranei TaxID=2778369 RepID=A0A8J3IY31_9CHLR|nr:aldo/keto reductase [Reticulibacter mediterranei]GHP00040.1 oxidoreductase [Reticulibacter mediterranei]